MKVNWLIVDYAAKKRICAVVAYSVYRPRWYCDVNNFVLVKKNHTFFQVVICLLLIHGENIWCLALGSNDEAGYLHMRVISGTPIL